MIDLETVLSKGVTKLNVNVFQYFIRNGKSVIRGVGMMMGNEFTLKEKATFIAIVIAGFILNLSFQPYGDLSDLFWGFFIWVFIANGAIFGLREYLIFQKEKEYRKRVGSIGETLFDIEKEKPASDEINAELKTTWKTNEDAYHQYKADFNRLRDGIQAYTEHDIKSEISIKEDLNRFSDIVNTASFKINDVFNCPTYRVKPELEDWLMKNALPVVDSANEKIKYLQHSLEELKNGRMSIKTGVEGEILVEEYLDDFKETLLPLYGVRFQSEKGTVENDVLLFTQQGVFSLEIKNIGASGNKAVKVSKDGLWYEKGYYDWKRSDRDKIFDQVNRHTALTERLIGQKFGFEDKYQVKSMVVIPNKNLEIQNESIFQIVRPNQIIPLIREMPVILSKEECIDLQRYVQSQDIGQAKFEHLDSEFIVNEILAVYKSLVEDCAFLEKTYVVQETYVREVTNNNVSRYLRLKYLNCDESRSVL